MVEIPENCVLQWAGHAGYITERFSGLLARQALVDVTLICEEQKLRVHKLVLASNSLYFEEILQQDLGQEPIIFLKDLNFEILKAMVEFMYCGETTISYQSLPSLLNAARIFKVKELVNIIDVIMNTKISVVKLDNDNDAQTNDRESKSADDTLEVETSCIDVKYGKLSKDECSLLCNSNNTSLSSNQCLENHITAKNSEEETEHTSYEETYDEGDKYQANTLFTMPDLSTKEQQKSCTMPSNCKVKEAAQKYCRNTVENDEKLRKDQEPQPTLFERCCDFSDVDECEQTCKSLSRTCPQQSNTNSLQYPVESTDGPSKVGKYIKVYSHKRRKSADEVKSQLVHANNLKLNLPSTDCIDLLDEPSPDNVPTTLLTSLDIESAEYILSLSTENIQSIVGCTVSEQHTLDRYKDIDVQNSKESCNEYILSSQNESAKKKEVQLANNSSNNVNTDSEKPVLRRSLRLNQQDHEESACDQNGEDKQFTKGNLPGRTESYVKGKRKVKDADHKATNQSIIAATNRKTFGGARAHKNNSKLIVKKTAKTTCSSKDREDHKTKVNNKSRSLERIRSSSIVPLHTVKSGATEYINRALWGDMSDILENNENRLHLPDYTTDREIPFALGLLPLRTALEKMQATPDYQPRKTRSSVAPFRQDVSSLKRKISSVNSAPSFKKHCDIGSPSESANAICHIQIRTAPSQYVKSRKKFLAEHNAATEAANLMSRQ